MKSLRESEKLNEELRESKAVQSKVEVISRYFMSVLLAVMEVSTAGCIDWGKRGTA